MSGPGYDPSDGVPPGGYSDDEPEEEKGYPKKVMISCPICGVHQEAEEHFYKGDPFPTLLHKCSGCDREIGEDEWDEVKNGL